MRSSLFLALVILTFSLHAKGQNVSELTDRKNIVFARNLKDWQMKPVDSLMFDIYYPTGATSNKKYPISVYTEEAL
jgi:hypothetical protein